jgi:site-specific recombinase XerD
MARNFTVEEAGERYLRERAPELSDSTIRNHRYAIESFAEFCEQEGVNRISDIDAFLISDFRLDRMDEVKNVTAYNNMSSLRKFVRWCESRELIESGIADGIIMPDVSDDSRDAHISPEEAKAVLEYLEKYEYATIMHALFALLWDTGIRIGAARALNVADVNIEQKYISLKHRPEQGTPLKNGQTSEREVNLSTWSAQILDDYINGRRTNVTDDHENQPLFSTNHGRAHRNTLSKRLNALTRPCHYGNDCPHDREINDCEANSFSNATNCPSSVSPHPIRRSAITHWLDEGNSKELLSDRMDVSVEVLEEHYDARSEEQKRELRREMLDIE